MSNTQSHESFPPTVTRAIPEFQLDAAWSGLQTTSIVSKSDLIGSWYMLLFYPRDFSFVCPTELTSFSAHFDDLQARDCKVFGISGDDIETHHQWLDQPVETGGLGPIRFPLCADPNGEFARRLGVWQEEQEVALRALMIVDPEGIIQYAVVHSLSVGRNVEEAIRVLDALQNGGLCAANWQAQDGNVDVELALMPGKVLGHYRIEEKLGQGSSGTVFAAWDMKLHRHVALKVLRQHQSEARAQLLTEARTAAQLNHPAICTIYSVEEQEGLPVIVMEKIRGGTLKNRLDSGCDAFDLMAISTSLTGALNFAHRRGIVHGDLKPSNILLTEDGLPKIVDFGLAHRLNANRDQTPPDSTSETEATESSNAPSFLPSDVDFKDVEFTLPTQDSPNGSDEFSADELTIDKTIDVEETSNGLPSNTSSLRGTPAYMSPEHIRREQVKPPSDIYSLGLLIYELATGQRLRSEVTVKQLLNREVPFDLDPQRLEAFPERSRGLLQQMLADDPSKRPTAEDLLQELRNRSRRNLPEA